MTFFAEAFKKRWSWGYAKRRDPQYWVDHAERSGFPYRAKWPPMPEGPMNYKAYWHLLVKESPGFDAGTFEDFVIMLNFFYPDKWQTIRKEVVLELDKIKRAEDEYDRGYEKARAKGYRYGMRAHGHGLSAEKDATIAYMKSMEAKGYVGTWGKMKNLYTLLVEKYPFPFDDIAQ